MMTIDWKTFAIGLATLVLLDGLYLSMSMPRYRRALGDISRDDMQTSHLAAGFAVWPVLVLGIMMFVLPLAASAEDAFRLGGLFMASVYLTFNLTSYAVFRYPASIAILDSAWGTRLGAIVATVMFSTHSPF